MNVSILYFLPHIARYRYGITKRDYKHNQFYFLIIQVKFSRLKIFLHLLEILLLPKYANSTDETFLSKLCIA